MDRLQYIKMKNNIFKAEVNKDGKVMFTNKDFINNIERINIGHYNVNFKDGAMNYKQRFSFIGWIKNLFVKYFKG